VYVVARVNVTATSVFGLLLFVFPAVHADPATPVILEPEYDGQLVSGSDVHMVTDTFADPDGHAHLCTDWEIRLDEAAVWEAPCATGSGKVHIHLGDGTFTGHYAGRQELEPELVFRLAVRHRGDCDDPDGEWSEWAERSFRTSQPRYSPPLSIRDVRTSPVPSWTVSHAGGGTLRLEAPDRVPYLEIRAGRLDDAMPLLARSAVRVVLTAGAEEWVLPQSELSFEDENAIARVIHLPAIRLQPGARTEMWVSANGGTHRADPDSRTPDFRTILRGAPVPWRPRQRGFAVEAVAEGLQLPVNLAFVLDPREGPDAPLYYVSELYGTVKVVTRAGEVRDFAKDLLDFVPTGEFPGSGESGLAGIAVDPQSGDVFITGIYWPGHAEQAYDPRVLRLRPSADGLSAESVKTVVAFQGEAQSASHQISDLSFGWDGMLYVHVGDALEHEHAQNLDTVRGKILRMHRDGTPATDNPFYDESNGIGAADYVYALGLRNPFGGSWRAADQSLYCVENGPSTDRLTRIVSGRNYLWDGTDASMRHFAVHTWYKAAPVQIAFVQPESFAGSGFPPQKLDSAFVTESGPTWASGVQSLGKRITEIVLRDDAVETAPLVEYDGTGRATAAGIAAGPDGLYFTELYCDYGCAGPVDRGARVFRVRWTGYAAFGADVSARDRRTVTFVDRSDVPGATVWNWDFGDGTFSSERNPLHTYAQAGTYAVRLAVTGAAGTVGDTKLMEVGSTWKQMTGEYFADPEFQVLAARGTVEELAFQWSGGSPAPEVPADGFSARWTGSVRPRFSEAYRFTVRSDDRVKVTVGSVVVVDGWTGNRLESIELEAGRDYPLVIEYRHDTGDAAVEVLWESDTQPVMPVPRLYPYAKRSSVRH
jgi:glucose/arabinose dehydrogenase